MFKCSNLGLHLEIALAFFATSIQVFFKRIVYFFPNQEFWIGTETSLKILDVKEQHLAFLSNCAQFMPSLKAHFTYSDFFFLIFVPVFRSKKATFSAF